MTSPAETGPIPEETTYCPPDRRKLVLVSAILASSLGFIDGTVVSIAIPAIRADLSASLSAAQWVSSAYLLMVSALVMAGGALGDRYGLRTVFATGIGLFLSASLLCAVAPDAALLIAARLFQGLGAAIMVPGSLAIIAKAYPPADRGHAIGIWAAASAATSALGPLGGGLLLGAAGDWGWRLIFAINLPLGIVALWVLFLTPADRPEGSRRLDIPGIAIATLALAVLAFGLTGGAAALGGGENANAPPADWSVTAAGLALFAGFIVWEKRARQPMMPLALFADAGFSGANLATFCLYFALSAILFFLPMTLITAWNASAAQTALVFLPITLCVGIMSGPVGRLAARKGARRYMTAGSLVCAGAYAAMAMTMHLEAFWSVLLPLMALMGFGMGLLVSPLSAAVMTSVPDRQTGIASAVNNTVARLSGLMATASLGGLVSAVFAASAGSAVAGVAFGQVPPPEISGVQLAAWREASNAAFSAICWIAAILSLAAAGLSWFMLEDGAARRR